MSGYVRSTFCYYSSARPEKYCTYCKEDAALRLYLPFPSSRVLMPHHAVWVGFYSFPSFKPADKYLTHFFYGFKLLPLQA